MQEEMDKANLQSLIVNTVHDSIVLDVHPDEKESVLQCLKVTSDNIQSDIFLTWGVDVNVPLALEAKIGPDWLSTVDVDLYC